MSFDLEEIKERFKEVIRYSQGIEEPMIDELFDTTLQKPVSYASCVVYKRIGTKLYVAASCENYDCNSLG